MYLQNRPNGNGRLNPNYVICFCCTRCYIRRVCNTLPEFACNCFNLTHRQTINIISVELCVLFMDEIYFVSRLITQSYGCYGKHEIVGTGAQDILNAF